MVESSSSRDEAVSPPPIECHRLNSLESTTSEGSEEAAPTTTTTDDTRRQRIYATAYTLAAHIVSLRQNEVLRRREAKLALRLDTLVEEMLTQYRIPYQGIVRIVSEKEQQGTSALNAVANTDKSSAAFFIMVVNEMFADKQVNWGRIVAMFAFLRVYVNHLRNKQSSDAEAAITNIVQVFATYISDHLGGWIHANGGWDGLELRFPHRGTDKDWEHSLMKGLLVTGVGFGLLAGLIALRR